ncbi:MAG: FtsW/RodA/SpoVE family cell cycle protein [Chlamydiales bacterium]|nr:FtsW/RodA/SpoVE family cell cycle protein [Chlamydiales bacterium]
MKWLNTAILRHLDFRVLPIILSLMCISLLVISSNDIYASLDNIFFTPRVKSQVQWFLIGIAVYLFFAVLDYNVLREWTWILYIIMLIALVGLFFTETGKNVQRWYKLPFMKLQPSEIAKLIIVLTLAWFLDRRKAVSHTWKTAIIAGIIVGIPFILIFKQPDLGTALLLFPITLVMFYFGGVKRSVIRLMSVSGACTLVVVLFFFLGIFSHKEMRPIATVVLKDYQYDRLDPNTYHQKAALIAIGSGGLTGSGWKESEFTRKGWLPEAQTDSVFPAFAEEFGFIGIVAFLGLYYALIYFSFQVTAVAKDHFGCLLSSGITTYLAMHVIVNVGMMSGLLPITGVPLILMSYGGSSVLATMTALGILQSIYSRRFMF